LAIHDRSGSRVTATEGGNYDVVQETSYSRKHPGLVFWKKNAVFEMFTTRGNGFAICLVLGPSNAACRRHANRWIGFVSRDRADVFGKAAARTQPGVPQESWALKQECKIS
jgi:hypothetical protein